MSALQASALHSDGLDLHAGVLGQLGHLHAGAGRGILREEGRVGGVHLGKVVQVLEEDGGLHHILQRAAGLGEDGFHVLHALHHDD